jgi:serine protease inhibitor
MRAVVGLSLALALDCASGLSGVRAVDASTPAGATAASNAFGLDLYARIKHDGDNLICSPLSAAVALNMASAGALGPTLTEMQGVLHIDAQRAAGTHASFGGLLRTLNARDGTDGLQLRVADRLWGQSGIAFRPDFVAQTDWFAYARAGDVQVIELPYYGDLSMVVVLPDGAGDLPAVERTLGQRYANWMAALRPTRVDLWLPRWTMSSRLDLVSPLNAAGMRLAFTAQANFSGISDVATSIAKVVQVAFIDVDETGTEAAAATAVGMELLYGNAPQEKPVIFHADHPFLYLLRDRRTGAVLFLGRVAALGE